MHPAHTDFMDALSHDKPHIRLHVLLDSQHPPYTPQTFDILTNTIGAFNDDDTLDLPYVVSHLDDVVDDIIDESHIAHAPYVYDSEGNRVDVDAEPGSLHLDPEIISISEMFTIARRYYPPKTNVLAAFMDFHNAHGVIKSYAPGTYRIQRKVYADEPELCDRAQALEQLHHTPPYIERWQIANKKTSPHLYGWPTLAVWSNAMMQPYALPHAWVDCDGSYQSLVDVSSGHIIARNVRRFINTTRQRFADGALLAVVDAYV